MGKNKRAIVKTYMAHHQALILLSINNYLNSNILKRRFFNNQEIKTLEILLQERVPQNIILTKKKKEKIDALKYVDYEEYSEKIITNPNKSTNILSNENYTLIITDEGEGYSCCNGDLITRYNQNQKNSYFIFIKDLKDNKVWTNTKVPFINEPDSYRVEFLPDCCKFYRSDFEIGTTTKITVSPEDNVEIRSVTITNNQEKNVELEIISYLESPLCQMEADMAHLAFSNLFLTIRKYNDAYILKRNKRGAQSKNKYLVHFALRDDSENKFDIQTDKGNIVGEGNDFSTADIIFKDKKYNNETSLNPNTIISLKTKIALLPRESKTINYICGYAENENECTEIYEKYNNIETIKRTFELALSRSIVENRFLGYRYKETTKYNDILKQIMYGSDTRKRYEEIILKNQLKQKDLWKFGISGDIPIVMVRIKSINETEIISQLVSFSEYINHKNIKIDLVILNGEENSYEQFIKEKIYEILNTKNANRLLNIKGGIHIIKEVQITEEEKYLLYACSDVIFDAHLGTIENQL